MVCHPGLSSEGGWNVSRYPWVRSFDTLSKTFRISAGSPNGERQPAGGFREARQLLDQLGPAQRGALRDGVDGRPHALARMEAISAVRVLALSSPSVKTTMAFLPARAGKVAAHPHQGVEQGGASHRLRPEDRPLGGTLVGGEGLKLGRPRH